MTHLNRRHLLSATVATALAPFSVLGQTPPRILFVHGRSQGDRTRDEIFAEWTAALAEGAQAAGLAMPAHNTIALPFYGKDLDDLVAATRVETAGRITNKGDETQDDYLIFQAELAEDIRTDLGITDAEIDEFYDDDLREKGPLNWRWVHAIVRAIDARSDTLTANGLELVTRDVFVYLEFASVRDIVDSIVAAEFTSEPTIVVGHSLGSVVAFNVLRSGNYNVPALITLGSPLGINAIRRRLAPIAHPNSVGEWVNLYDDRDIVALNSLDAKHFNINPGVRNISDIKNHTNNRHGISGYLNTPKVATEVLSRQT